MLLTRKIAGCCSRAFAVAACLAAAPSLTVAQTSSTAQTSSSATTSTTTTSAANAALIAAKTSVTQAQTEQSSAQLETLRGQNSVVQAQLAAEKALTAQRQAQDNLNVANHQIQTLANRLKVMKAIPLPGAPHDVQWNNLMNETQTELDQATARLVSLQTALANATAQITTDGNAVNRAQGTLDQLQKNEQKANDKFQQAIQSLLNQVQASSAAATSTKTAAASPTYPLLLATALTPMYISAWGTPIGLYQPPTPWLYSASSGTQVVHGLQSVPPGCDPVPRLPVCSWTPGVLGATPVMTSSPQETIPLPQSSPASPQAAPPNENHSQVSTPSIFASESTLAHQDAFSSLPSVKVISLDQKTMAREAGDDVAEATEIRPQPYQSDYRFDLPARFALAQFDSKQPCRSLEGEGAVIHEGMRILTRKDGQYDVRFNVTVPAMPVTMRLQLLLYDHTSRPFPQTLTLPPIRITPESDADHDDFDDAANPPRGGTPLLSYLVCLSGYSHVVRDHSGSFLLAKRTGTARFGNGVELQQR